MKLTDPSVITFGAEDERRRTPEPEEMWQDSVVLTWWDLDNHVGGYHRIGHQPAHRDGPRAHVSSAFFARDRVLKRNETLVLRAEDQPASGGFGSGDGTIGYEFTDHAIWTFAEEHVQGELHIHDFHTPLDIYPKSGQVSDRMASGHLEAGGAITGQLVLDGHEYAIDGLAFRDRGWGQRYWREILGHRWVAASFGAEATVLAVSIVGSSGALVDFGCVIRGDELTYAKELDIVTYMERDALTHRGGRVRMELTDGELIEMDAEVLQKGAVSFMAGEAAINDTMCRITWGDRVGICDFEISNNASAGGTVPVAAINGFVEDGLHRSSATP